MHDPSIQFVSGLPRSGTTLLMNLLGQNPEHHVTPTSGLIHLVLAVQRKWAQCQEFRAQGLAEAKPFVLGGLRGLMAGFFSEPLSENKIVFDKSRGWIEQIEIVEQILQRRIKVITLVRDVRGIAASWEKVYRRRGIEHRAPVDRHRSTASTTRDRIERALNREHVTGRSVVRVRDAVDRCPDRLLIVPYKKMSTDPVGTLQTIHDVLDLPEFEYDPQHVRQMTYEDDNYLGSDLHTIRERVEPEQESFDNILSPRLSEWIAKEFEDINRLAAGPVVDGADLQ